MESIINLEAYVDSSSESYLREVRENIASGWGKIYTENPFSSAFVSEKSIRVVRDHYPLYSGGSKEVRN